MRRATRRSPRRAGSPASSPRSTTPRARSRKAIFFSATIIIAGFLPLFTLSGVEGHIFGPMAKTYAYALSGGLLATFTVSPALAAVLLPSKVSETETIIVRSLRRLYRRVIGGVLVRRGLTLAVGASLVALAVFAASTVGLEFLPKLEEGNIWLRAALPPSVSLDEGNVYANRMRRLVKSFPEVETVITQHGRPDDGTDPDGFSNVEFFVPLKPADKWRKGLTKEELIAEMGDALRKGFPGVTFGFSQYIQDNVQEAASGIDAENAIKITGPDLDTLRKIAVEIRGVLEKVRGITDIQVPPLLGPADHQDRHRPPARRPLRPVARRHQRHHPGRRRRPGGGRPLRGGQRPPLPHAGAAGAALPREHGGAPAHRHRRARAERRRRPGAARRGRQCRTVDRRLLHLPRGAGALHPGEVQRARPRPGRRRARGAAEGGGRGQAAERLPPRLGRRLRQFPERHGAARASPCRSPSALILLLLYVSFGSLADTLIAGSAIPMALVGGILGLWLADMSFSISAAIGFVALFGIAAMNGIMVLGCFNRLIEGGLEREAALRQTCELQMRPVLMTCVAACVGLLPAAFSTAIGSQVQRPLAIVVVGGMLLAPCLFLTVLPA